MEDTETQAATRTSRRRAAPRGRISRFARSPTGPRSCRYCVRLNARAAAQHRARTPAPGAMHTSGWPLSTPSRNSTCPELAGWAEQSGPPLRPYPCAQDIQVRSSRDAVAVVAFSSDPGELSWKTGRHKQPRGQADVVQFLVAPSAASHEVPPGPAAVVTAYVSRPVPPHSTEHVPQLPAQCTPRGGRCRHQGAFGGSALRKTWSKCRVCGWN